MEVDANVSPGSVNPAPVPAPTYVAAAASPLSTNGNRSDVVSPTFALRSSKKADEVTKALLEKNSTITRFSFCLKLVQKKGSNLTVVFCGLLKNLFTRYKENDPTCVLIPLIKEDRVKHNALSKPNQIPTKLSELKPYLVRDHQLPCRRCLGIHASRP